MKIALDISMLSESNAGIPYYAYELTKSLIKNTPENTYFLLRHDEQFFEFERSENVKLVTINSQKAGLKWIIKASRFLKKEKVDCLISPSNFSFSFFYPETYQIVHDIAPLKYPEFFSKKSSKMYALQLNLCMKKARKILTNSETTRKDLLKKYGKKYSSKIETIGIGLNSWVFSQYTKEKANEVKKKYNLPDKYILSVSTLEPRKNHVNMIRAFKEFLRIDGNSEYKYVIVGKKGWYYERIFEEVRKLDLSEKVDFLGYVPEEDLPVIFDNAEIFAYVSTWEGVGMPPMEAYMRGVPAVVSDIEVFKETMDGKALFANHEDHFDIALKLINSLIKKYPVDKNFIQQYSWEKVSTKVLQNIKK